MAERTCEVPDCEALTTWRRGNPAKHCEFHRAHGRCEYCGAGTHRAPGVTRGPLPRFCDRRCRYALNKAAQTPEQLEETRRRSRELCRFDMFCLDCGELIPRRDDGLRRNVRCDECRSLHRASQCARKDRDKKFRAYGLTVARYESMLAAQGGGCAFCGSTRAHPTKDHDFYIDHDHTCCPGKNQSCGKCVRFLLCSRCNVGIGYFADSPEVLRAAADALELYSLSATAEGTLLRGAVHA